MMFLLLKSEGISTQDHPVLVRLRQYQNLIEKLRAVFDGVVKSQIEVLLEQEVSSAQEVSVINLYVNFFTNPSFFM